MSRELIKILTIDGGGIRGLIPAIFLAEIEERCGRPAHQLFDVITGTSTGALVTAMVTLPEPHTYSGEALVDYYLSTRPNTFFTRSLAYKLRSGNGMLRPKYPASSHITALQDALGTDAGLKDAQAEIVIPIYDLRSTAPRTFMFTRANAQRDPNMNFPIWEVVRAASTASGYFPGWTLKNAQGVDTHHPVDGGIFMNNPVLAGFAHAVDMAEERSKRRGAVTVNGHEFLLVSLGTGFFNEPIHDRHEKHWGFAGWAPHLMDTMFEGQSEEADRQARAILSTAGPFQHYLRLQTQLAGDYKLDDIAPEIRASLKASAEATIRERGDDIDTICQELS